jgi:hypothetical protein
MVKNGKIPMPAVAMTTRIKGLIEEEGVAMTSRSLPIREGCW